MYIPMPDDGDMTRHVPNAGLSVAATSADALETTCDPERLDVVVLDIRAPAGEVAEAMRDIAAHGRAGCIILAGGDDKQMLSDAMVLGRSLGLRVVAALGGPLDVPALREQVAEVQARIEPILAQRSTLATEGEELVLE